jgi:hypothetical protein
MRKCVQCLCNNFFFFWHHPCLGGTTDGDVIHKTQAVRYKKKNVPFLI